MSGKFQTKKQKLFRKGLSLNYNLDTCPYCEEQWPMELLVEHMSCCCKSYLSSQRRKTVRKQVQSLLYEYPECNETHLEIDVSEHESTACTTLPNKSRYYLGPFTSESHKIAEDDEIKSETTKAAIAGLKESRPESKGADRLIQSFENILQNEWCSDVVLKTTDHEFRAHRLILGARSPVFASMFQHDMIEKKTGEVDVSDCSTAGFKAFLQFLYSGKADVSPANVLYLYYAADKYQVDDLKEACVEYMKYSLSEDTFCDVIGLSLRHGESELQAVATQFFCINIKAIVKTTQWQEYLTENPVHANELIIRAIDA